MPDNTDPAQDMVPVRVEVAPGKMALMNIPRKKVGKFGLMKVVIRGDGTPLIVWKSWHTKVKLTRDLPAKLGIDVHVETLRALVYAGIVDGVKFSPSLILIDLDSLAHHMEQATGAGARDYWTAERQDAYSQAWKAIHSATRGMTERARRPKPKPAPGTKPQRPLRVSPAKPLPAKPTRPDPNANQMDLFQL